MRFLPPTLLALCLVACAGGPPQGVVGPNGGVCETVSCNAGDEVFCGEPEVRLGTGWYGFEAIEAGGEMPVIFSESNNDNCGYHLNLAFETENMCPVVQVDYQVHLLGVDGGPIADGTRRIQFVRDPDGSSVQQIWSIAAHLPPAFYPNDPMHADVCPRREKKMPCDESQFLIEVQVEDWAGRFTSTQALYDPVCCD